MYILKHCPACSSCSVSGIVSIADFPVILFPTDALPANEVITAPLEAAACASCGHMFLSHIDAELNRRIYQDYYYLYPFSHLETMNDAYRQPFENVFDMVLPRTRGRLLDIGCSDAAQLFPFVNRGYRCTGISPGAEPSESVQMINAYFEDVTFDPFDTIVSRFNLEHVVDLGKFLAKVLRELVPGGRFIVQVPNPRSFLEAGILNVFAHEHTQYFSPSSLRRALEYNGFIVEMNVSEGPSIIAVAKKPAREAAFQDMLSVTEKLANDVAEAAETHGDRQLVLYGAGLSLTGLLYGSQRDRFLKLQDRIKIVDDNKALWGRRMPLTTLRVEAFDPVKVAGNVIFLLLNPIYHRRIIGRMPPTGTTIYSVDADGLKRIAS